MRMADVEKVGARLGRHSYQVVSAHELLAAGVDMSVVARLVATRRWQRLWRGMYLCGPGPLSPVARAHAALKHVAPRPRRPAPDPAAETPTPPARAASRPAARAVISGLAGCARLGLRYVPAHTRVLVLVPTHVRTPSNKEVLVRRTRDVGLAGGSTVAGVRIAEASRCVADGARECSSLRDVRGLVLAAIADRITTPAELRALASSGGTRGAAWLRRAIRDAERGAASAPEAEVVDALIGRGIPFVVNAEIWLDGVLLAVFDIYLLGTGMGAEVDSVEWHGSSESMSLTLDRHERSSSRGLSLKHVTPKKFRADPSGFVDRLLAEAAERQVRGLGEPPGLEIRARGPVLR